MNNNYDNHFIKDVTTRPGKAHHKENQLTHSESEKSIDSPLDLKVQKEEPPTQVEIAPFFKNFLDSCSRADKSTDMKLLIDKKLIRYYSMVHPDFINSKSFRKNVEKVGADIDANPSLVYLKITGIIEELKIRKKSNNTVMANEDVTSTGNEKKDKQLKKLNKALYILKKKIAVLEQEEVNFEEDHNSSYMMVERHKKRAWEVSYFF